VELETIIPLTMAKLKFGIGATEELGYELGILGARKVLLVTDRRLREHGLVDKVVKHQFRCVMLSKGVVTK